jgi:hypothetical protein
MKKLSLVAIALLALLPLRALAHRLDEYLQATIFSITPHRIDASIRLVPGVAVAPAVIASIDTNGDGVLSPTEQRAYAQRVLNDLLLSLDDRPLALHLNSVSFPSIGQMKQGVGEIQLTFTAEMLGNGAHHSLTFENHHQPAISAYLVNSLVPQDDNIQIAQQSRNENQSVYQLEFAQRPAAGGSIHLPGLSGFTPAFRLGLHHIAEGTDHLLFLLVLLLPAPLLAFRGRWSQPASVKHSLAHILGIVTAFTLGHSLTLALAAFGLIQLPSRPVEILIAVSILVSAAHAIRPLFPGCEAAIAAFFGLIHGLAFASALNDLGVSGWYRLVSLFGFNLGIESMQLAVVAAVLPSLLLLSRAPTYSVIRLSGALFAAVAAGAWIVERSFNTANPIDPLVTTLAHHSPLIAGCLFLFSLTSIGTRAARQNISHRTQTRRARKTQDETSKARTYA